MGIPYFLYWGERLPYGQGFDAYFRLEKMFEKVGETFSKILQIVQCMPAHNFIFVQKFNIIVHLLKFSAMFNFGGFCYLHCICTFLVLYL